MFKFSDGFYHGLSPFAATNFCRILRHAHAHLNNTDIDRFSSPLLFFPLKSPGCPHLECDILLGLHWIGLTYGGVITQA